MNNLKLKIALLLNYFVFAILLNTVGAVILQVQHNYGIPKGEVGILEAFKDYSIAITSFFAAAYVIKIGYKRTMLIALAVVIVACLFMPIGNSFLTTKLMFAAAGFGFALIKVTVFASIGLVTNNQKEHLSFMNFLESIFMVGIVAGNFIIASFIDNEHPESTTWLKVYYILAALVFIAFVLLLFTSINESKKITEKDDEIVKTGIGEMLKMIAVPLVLIFILCAFFYVLVEQSIMSWLPTFNKDILKLSSTLSIKMASILALAIGLGRFFAGFILKKINWFYLLVCCLLLAGILVLVTVPLTSSIGGIEITSLGKIPLVGFEFPLIGLFLAPIYPTINSLLLSSFPKKDHPALTGLIVVFSAIGGSTGSIITGKIFGIYGGQTAFYCSLVPIALLICLLIAFRYSYLKRNNIDKK